MSRYIPFIIVMFSALLMAVIGIAIKYRKAYWLISGYNTMSKEKKKNVDIKNLGEFSGNMCLIISGIILVAAVFMLFNQTMAGIMFFLLLPVSIYTIIKSQSYDGNTRKPDGTMKTGTKVLLSAVIGFLVLTAVGVGVLLYLSAKPAEYSVKEDHLGISGLYGEDIEFKNINALTLEEQIPKILSKSNGSSLGSKKKGYFRLEDVGKAKLFLESDRPPFIFIDTGSGLRIVNTGEKAQTEKLYTELTAAWRKSWP